MTDLDLDAWIRAEPDPHHRAALEEARDGAGLTGDAATPLRFGTAGLRGAMGPGPGRMNRVVVRVAARAIGRQLVADGVAERGVSIAHDARPDSDRFALDSARVLRALGIPVTLIDGPVPTPVLAHHALAHRAAAGIMVTASHNPRGDNGYKVYWTDGAQLRSPLDRHIEDRMDFRVLPGESALAPDHEVHRATPRGAIAEYLGSLDVPERHGGGRAVYTALCGVGAETIDLAFATAGLAPLVHVREQRLPDGSFPGLPFPNPEEPGTLDLALALAEDEGIDLVLANDPDADRLGVAIHTPDGWWKLTGDEIGTLLCDHRIETTAGDDRIAASSIVSGGMVGALCRSRGVEHAETLTGFKWIMRPAIDRPDRRWIFGYEEALGFSVGDRVRDKDGISAAVAFVALVERLRASGSSPRRRLDELAAEVGVHETAQVSVRGDRHSLDAAIDRLRVTPPREVAGRAVSQVDDWAQRPEPENTNLLVLHFDHGRIAVRPSGTEPKVKAYLEWRADGVDLEDVTAARAASRLTLDELATAVRGWFTD